MGGQPPLYSGNSLAMKESCLDDEIAIGILEMMAMIASVWTEQLRSGDALACFSFDPGS